MSEKTFSRGDTILIAWIMFVLGMAVGLAGGRGVGRSQVQTEAIEAGVAEYVMIDNHGNTEFHWIVPEVEEHPFDWD